MDFLKNIAISLISVLIGLGIASYFNDPKNPSPLAAVIGAFSSIKTTLSGIPQTIEMAQLPQQSSAKEGTATFGISMTEEEILEARKYFNTLSGIDVEKREKEKQEKEKQEKEKKDAEKKESASQKEEKSLPIPSSLFVVKKTDSLNHSMTQGTVYAFGTLPYGPPSSVKYKIFEKGSLLSIESDPNATAEKERGHLEAYQKPAYALPLMKNSVQNITRPVLDPKNTFTVQLGAFEQEADARTFKKNLLSKGYDVGVYKDQTHKDKAWFYVRLNEALTEHEAHQYKDQIANSSSVVPMVVLVQGEIQTE